jgi:hypothetical protein
MRTSNILVAAVLTAVAFVFVGVFALASEGPATLGQERPTISYPAAISSSGNTTLQGLKVLIALAAQTVNEADEVKDSLLASGVAEVVDYYNLRSHTPSLPELLPYDCVITWSDYEFLDEEKWGNVLGDYVEAQGAVVACQFCYYDGWAIGGRFLAEYSPFNIGWTGYETHTLGWYDPTHPIMQGVTTCSEYYDFDVTHRHNVQDVARYDNDWPLVAINADQPKVAAINAFFGKSARQWTGDMMTILLNTVVYVAGAGPAAVIRCQAVNPIFCQGKFFHFKLTVKNNTPDNISGTLIFSGYSAYDCDPGNLLVAIPRPKTYAPGSTEEYYKFKVPSAYAPGPYSASVGGTLGGVDLFCCMNADIIACQPWRVGDNAEWELVEADRPEVALPTVTELCQNYPNPFNASTLISYQLPTDSHVKLEIYNLFGQKVATVVDGQQEAGYQSVTWDPSDVSSGLYFYKLTAGDISETKRMMLIK